MPTRPAARPLDVPCDLRLPVSLLTRYLFFLMRRPISRSNPHYLEQRLAGLRSLADVLAASDLPALDEVTRCLRAVNPGNFARLGEQLQYALLPLAPSTGELPWDVVVSDQPPRDDFLADVERVLLVLGPAIGVGDEIITFPLPTRLKAVHPRARVDVMSAYRGLWDRVDGVDSVRYYADHLELLEAVRGRAPGRAPTWSCRLTSSAPTSTRRSVTSRRSSGSSSCRSAPSRSSRSTTGTAGCTARRARRRTSATTTSASTTSCAGSASRPSGRSRARDRPARRPAGRRVRQHPVNPFTSKSDPAPAYWSHLISPCSRPRRRGRSASRSIPVRTRPPSASRPAWSARPPPVPPPASRWPWRGRPTGCRPRSSTSWPRSRAPASSSAPTPSAPTPLRSSARPPSSSPAPASSTGGCPIGPATTSTPRPRSTRSRPGRGWSCTRSRPGGSRTDDRPPRPPRRALVASADALRAALEGGPDADPAAVRAAYDDFVAAQRAVVVRLGEWPADFRALFGDVDYERRCDPAVGGQPPSAELTPAYLLHLRDRLGQWENTNLHKYLSASGAVPSRAAGVTLGQHEAASALAPLREEAPPRRRAVPARARRGGRGVPRRDVGRRGGDAGQAAARRRARSRATTPSAPSWSPRPPST